MKYVCKYNVSSKVNVKVWCTKCNHLHVDADSLMKNESDGKRSCSKKKIIITKKPNSQREMKLSIWYVCACVHLLRFDIALWKWANVKCINHMPNDNCIFILLLVLKSPFVFIKLKIIQPISEWMQMTIKIFLIEHKPVLILFALNYFKFLFNKI